MNQCFKITLGADTPDVFLRSFIQKHARSLSLEGIVQRSTAEGVIHIIVCGGREQIDDFLDLVYKGTQNYRPENVSVEPFLHNKDYRGVFRVIE